MANKKYWQSFGELNNSEAYEKSISNEFKENYRLKVQIKKEWKPVLPPVETF